LQGILQFYQVENTNVKKLPTKEEIEKFCGEIHEKSWNIMKPTLSQTSKSILRRNGAQYLRKSDNGQRQ
jgi:hypothetical protein